MMGYKMPHIDCEWRVKNKDGHHRTNPVGIVKTD